MVASGVMQTTSRITLPGPFAGVLVDMDGTLVDTEPLWLVAKQRMFAAHDTTFEMADHVAVFGRDEQFTADYLTRRLGVDPSRRDEVRREYRSIVAATFREGVPLRPGALELLSSLRGVVPVGLATNTNRELVDIALDASGLRPYLDSVSTAESGAAKPAPDIYLAACGSLGLDPATSVAIEDSPTGIAAARAAGLTVIAVPSEIHDGLEAAHHIIPSLLDLLPVA
jgi:HAD superfamily hydrolase (TIGR01509 family)